MENSVNDLKSKVISFQRQILELKNEVSKINSAQNAKLKLVYTEVIDWADLLSMLIEDLKTNTTGDGAPATMQAIKSAERLNNRIERFFKSNSICKISETGDLNLQNEGVKIIEARPNPNFKDGTIIEVIRNGYTWNNQVLRKQEVITVRN
jgi:molecular chaperone GrpE (heat shock protein)